MAFVQLEDLNGSVELVFFPKALSACRAAIESGRPLLVRGKLERKPEGSKILAESAECMDDLRERRTRRVELLLRADEVNDDALPTLRTLLKENAGECPVTVVLEDSVGGFRARVRVAEEWRVTPSRAFVDGVRTWAGRPEALRLS